LAGVKNWEFGEIKNGVEKPPTRGEIAVMHGRSEERSEVKGVAPKNGGVKKSAG